MTRLAILISPNRNICIWTKTKVYRGDRVVMFTSSVSNAVNKYTHALVNMASNSTSQTTSHSTSQTTSHSTSQTTSQPKPNIYIPQHISSKITSYLIPTINYEQNSPLNMVFHQNTLLYTIYKNYITTQRQNKKMTILDEVRTRYGRVTKEPERFENITYLSGGTNMSGADQYDRGYANNHCGDWGSETYYDNSIGINTSSYNTNSDFIVNDTIENDTIQSDTIQSESENDEYFDSDVSDTDIDSDFEMEDLTDSED